MIARFLVRAALALFLALFVLANSPLFSHMEHIGFAAAALALLGLAYANRKVLFSERTRAQIG